MAKAKGGKGSLATSAKQSTPGQPGSSKANPKGGKKK